LILAHGPQDELIELLQALDDERNALWIHVDAKAKNIDLSKISSCTKHSAVHCIHRRKVYWGGFSVIDAELRLFAAARSHEHYAYYHVLSGVDFPTKSQDYIHAFFDEHDGLNFIRPVVYDKNEHFSLRYDQYHLFQDGLIGKKRNLWKYLDFSLCYLQKFLGVSRAKGRDMKAAHTWVSVTDDFVEFLLSKEQDIRHDYRWTYCCDEVFLMSTIVGTDFETTFSKEFSNLRYMEWTWHSKHDLSPRALTIDDLDALNEPNILFARKFENPQSITLKQQLKKSWN
jgi:hypothetical protein